MVFEKLKVGDRFAYRFWRLVYYSSWTNTCGVMVDYKGKRLQAKPLNKKQHWPYRFKWHWIK